MSRLRYNRRAAITHLRQGCPRMAQLIRQKGAFKLAVSKEPDLFVALARSVIYQQLSGKAAATIYGRFEALFENGRPCARAAVDMPLEMLRAAGLSNNKALSILDLAAKTCSRRLPSTRRLGAMDDDAVIARLCTVRGIGPWTAQMHLIFHLGRPDVMPATDLGIQKGVQSTYRLAQLPTPEQVCEVTRHLAPYRSAASWYLWRVVDD